MKYHPQIFLQKEFNVFHYLLYMTMKITYSFKLSVLLTVCWRSDPIPTEAICVESYFISSLLIVMLNKKWSS